MYAVKATFHCKTLTPVVLLAVLWYHCNMKLTLTQKLRYLLSAPFIYGMLFPAVAWHLCLEIYHQVCFRIYGIPLVNGRDYFINDRELMNMLKPLEKLNCVYCSYVNNLLRYSVEIAGRTERYWCPLKYHRRIKNAHSQYDEFIGEEEKDALRSKWKKLQEFPED